MLRGYSTHFKEIVKETQKAKQITQRRIKKEGRHNSIGLRFLFLDMLNIESKTGAEQLHNRVALECKNLDAAMLLNISVQMYILP